MDDIKVQIESLTGMVARGFADVQEQVGALDHRLTGLETRLDGLQGSLETFEDETRGSFRDVRQDIRELREISIPLSEYAEVLRRLSRLEEKLGIAG